MSTPSAAVAAPEITIEKNDDGSVAFKDKDGNVIFRTPSKAELDAARAKSKRLLEKAKAFIVLDHPFVATILLKRPITERLGIPTLAVTDTGNIYYNPFFIAGLTAEQVVWALAHEVMHYAYGHGPRRQTRDPHKWNIAADRVINDTLNQAGIGQKIEGCEDVPGSAERRSEDIYAEMKEEENKGKGKGKGKSGGGGGGNPDPLAGDMEHDDGSSTGQSADEIDAQRKLDVAEAAQVAKMKGKLPGVLAKFAADTIASKTPWYEILERFMTDRVKTDTTWVRPNRRYAPDFYMPTRDSIGSMGEIVLQVDISGSVSKQEIAHYNGHMKRIIEQCRPRKVHVIYTDTQVQKHEEFDRPEDCEISYHSGGGTHMPAGMKYVQDKGIEPEVFVTLTDGYTGWDSEPPFPTVHCISSKEQAPYGHNVFFELE